MTARRPLVRIGGVDQQLPAGDTLDAGIELSRLQQIYAGLAGAKIIEENIAGIALIANPPAMFPALSTTVTATPRDNVFTGSIANEGLASPVASNGTSAGVSMSAEMLVLSTGSTASGTVDVQFVERAIGTPQRAIDDYSSLEVEAVISIPTLSVAAQRIKSYCTMPSMNLTCYVTQVDNENSGAFTLNINTTSGMVAYSTGMVPTAGVSYRISVSIDVAARSCVLTITNLNTLAVATLTEAFVPAATEYQFEPSITAQKLVGTTARTLRLHKYRALLLK